MLSHVSTRFDDVISFCTSFDDVINFVLDLMTSPVYALDLMTSSVFAVCKVMVVTVTKTLSLQTLVAMQMILFPV